MEVQVIRSPRRKKTVEAKVIDGVLKVHVPATLSQAEEDHWVGLMKSKLERKLSSNHIDLERRAARLATAYDLPSPDTIVFSDRQNQRWGSCTPSSGRIRISRDVAAFPGWVLDYVIVHELAHLIERNHTKTFWNIVGRYPLAERARGYLIAKSGS